MKTSKEVESTRTKALAAISNLGAINAEQTLALLQNKLQKNTDGKVVVLNGGVEQDLNVYLSTLKNPGSGWEHHFKCHQGPVNATQKSIASIQSTACACNIIPSMVMMSKTNGRGMVKPLAHRQKFNNMTTNTCSVGVYISKSASLQ